MAERHADQPPQDSLDLSTEAGALDEMQARAGAPAKVLRTRQAEATSAAVARLWADPTYRERMSARFKAKWSDPEYRERASGNNRDDTVYGWRQVATGLTVRHTKSEMQEEFGLKADGLASVVAGRIMSTGGWELIPKDRMLVGQKWIFP